jgi:hypothetical protein
VFAHSLAPGPIYDLNIFQSLGSNKKTMIFSSFKPKTVDKAYLAKQLVTSHEVLKALSKFESLEQFIRYDVENEE